MRLESLESFKRDTSNFRLFAMVTIGCSIAGNIFLYYQSRKDIQEASQRIWVVDRNSRPFMAEIQNQFDYEGRIFEYEEVVREFYENAFSCDGSAIDDQGSENLERSLHLSGNFINGQTIEDLWWEEKIISNVLENNWIYEAEVDSVIFDSDTSPMIGYAFGKQIIKMRRQQVTRNMNFTFVIYDLASRTRQNPFAAKLDQLDLFNNTVISTKRE